MNKKQKRNKMLYIMLLSIMLITFAMIICVFYNHTVNSYKTKITQSNDFTYIRNEYTSKTHYSNDDPSHNDRINNEVILYNPLSRIK